MRPNRLNKIKQKQKQKPALSAATRLQMADNFGDGRSPYDFISEKYVFDNIKASLDIDLQRLKSKHDLKEKASLKAELLPRYWSFVADYMSRGHDYPNIVAVWVLIWLFDIGDIQRALPLAIYLARTKFQPTPASFDRDLKTFICDAVYDWASPNWKDNKSSSPYLDELVAVILDEKWELAMPVLSKMLSAMAKNEMAKRNYANAIHWSEKAEEVNPTAHGTKGLRKDALKALKGNAGE